MGQRQIVFESYMQCGLKDALWPPKTQCLLKVTGETSNQRRHLSHEECESGQNVEESALNLIISLMNRTPERINVVLYLDYFTRDAFIPKLCATVNNLPHVKSVTICAASPYRSHRLSYGTGYDDDGKLLNQIKDNNKMNLVLLDNYNSWFEFYNLLQSCSNLTGELAEFNEQIYRQGRIGTATRSRYCEDQIMKVDMTYLLAENKIKQKYGTAFAAPPEQQTQLEDLKSDLLSKIALLEASLPVAQ